MRLHNILLTLIGVIVLEGLFVTHFSKPVYASDTCGASCLSLNCGGGCGTDSYCLGGGGSCPVCCDKGDTGEEPTSPPTPPTATNPPGATSAPNPTSAPQPTSEPVQPTSEPEDCTGWEFPVGSDTSCGLQDCQGYENLDCAWNQVCQRCREATTKVLGNAVMKPPVRLYPDPSSYQHPHPHPDSHPRHRYW